MRLQRGRANHKGATNGRLKSLSFMLYTMKRDPACSDFYLQKITQAAISQKG
jgi:hypothetical protein